MNPVRNLTKKDYDRPQKKESIFNVTHWQRGQSLVELLLAIAVFIIVVSSLSFLILDSYVLSRLSQEMTTANFLAEEGLEARYQRHLRHGSAILEQLTLHDDLRIVGAEYSLETGIVDFFDGV